MPAKDIVHEAVKNALIKDGWTITDDPLVLEYGGFDLFIDLGAEKLLAAEKGGDKIAVEIKSFVQPSFITEFHAALGQFINYKLALAEEAPERTLYLALSDEVYQTYFQRPLVQKAVAEIQIHLIVCNLEQETVLQWLI